MDTEDDGFATGLSTCIAKDGQTTTTARIPFASGASAAAGSVSSVSYGQTNDNNTGLYFPATDEVGLVAGGTATIKSTASVVTIPSGVTLKANTTPYDAFAAGTAMMFVQTSAPTGWTKDTTNYNDRAIRIVSGAASAGGSVNFSTLFARTGTDAITVTQANLPNVNFTVSGITLSDPGHTHPYLTGGNQNNAQVGGATSLQQSPDSVGATTTSNTTGITISAQGSAASGGSGTTITPAIDMRVKYVDAIIAVKD